MGLVPYDTHLKILQVSSVHVYVTVPFVLSWSMLEAMAAGCVIVGSATPPVQEVISHNDNGLLFNHFSPHEFAGRVDQVLDDPNRKQNLGEKARGKVIERHGVGDKIEEYKNLYRMVISCGDSSAP